LSRRPTKAIIHRDAIGHNFEELKKTLPPTADIMAVVKADAYGHGACAVAAELSARGCPSFAVALASEGAELRESGITEPIIILGGIFSGDCEVIFSHDLTPVIHNFESASLINKTAKALGLVKPVHLKIDTGMARIGIRPSEAHDFFERLKGLANIRLEGLLSHFVEADVPKSPFSALQLKTFQETTDLAIGLGFNVKYLHMANSAAIVRMKEAHFNLVRPGIMLYGSYPAPDLTKAIDLKAVMELKTKVLQLKKLPEGTPVSYGRTFTTKRDSLVAVLPLGYGDGLPRNLSGRGDVLIKGARAPIIGLICMDLTVCDVTDIKDVSVGDDVTIIGQDSGEQITAEEIARITGTISYEVFCNISKRVPRIYL